MGLKENQEKEVSYAKVHDFCYEEIFSAVWLKPVCFLSVNMFIDNRGAVVAWRLESWACNLKVAGSVLAPAGIEGGDCEWTALSPPSIPWLRCPWARHRIPQLLPGRWSNGCPLLRVRVHSVCSLLTAVCVHLDGLNAEDQFRVWVTILDNTSHYYYYYLFIWSRPGARQVITSETMGAPEREQNIKKQKQKQKVDSIAKQKIHIQALT